MEEYSSTSVEKIYTCQKIMSDIFTIEEKRKELLRIISGKAANEKKIFAISEFLEYLLTINKPQVYSYLLEFLPEYSRYLENYTPLYKAPSHTKMLLKQLAEVTKIMPDNAEVLEKYHRRICSELSELESILVGDKVNNDNINNIQFPVLDSDCRTGFVEQVTVEVSKNSLKDEIIIIPSETEIESRLLTQVHSSLNEALAYINPNKKKTGRFHKVIIQFNKRIGFYIGNSMGIALTVALIEKLVPLYEIPYVLNINRNVVFTGGIKEGGDILPAANIREKTEIAFFSNAEVFVIPKENSEEADEQLKVLQKEFPRRRLILLPVKNLWDIFDRRSVVLFRKKNIAETGADHFRKNLSFYTILLLFVAIMYYSGVIDTDDNPAMLDMRGNVVFVLNKNGKELWSRELIIPNPDLKGKSVIDFLGLELSDVDNDGINEVFLCWENEKWEKISCYNKNGDLRWEYVFKDSIENQKDGKIKKDYVSNIVSIKNFKGKNILYCLATHNPNYASAIYKLDASNGRRLPGTLWHAGRFLQGYIDDFNRDGKEEIILNFVNNGFQAAGIVSIDIEKIIFDQQLPSAKEYSFFYHEKAEYNEYVLFPRTDVSVYSNDRYNYPSMGGLRFESAMNLFSYHISETSNDMGSGVLYFCDTNLENFSVEVNDRFRVLRDSLVVNDILDYPLTDTKEYRELLLNKITKINYWNSITSFLH
jgi:hypothetical protein